MRVAIDGRTGCGKSTFAAALAASLTGRGRAVIHTTIDGFHNPKAVRYARGRLCAEGYYRDARDLGAVRRELLDPLGPGGTGIIRTGIFDLAEDAPRVAPPMVVAPGTLLLVDGTFLARPELVSAWDVIVLLRTREATARARGIARDIEAGGAPEAVTASYDQRYLPAFALYLAEADPDARAHVLIDLEDLAAPRLLKVLA